ncbi:MAG: integrase core domain-containing protein, partial [Candidatus Saccharibacteria bacterium]|nr:integrase core domain-containing protein [Candidatus Saccharibacteria bacterium]
RVRQPNDNAHIERFNRTLRQECIGNHVSSRLSCEDINSKLRDYLDYYNFRRHHMGIEFRTPISMLHR